MIATAGPMWQAAAMRLIAALIGLAAGLPCQADAPEIVAAEAYMGRMGWTVRVTLRHEDSGWDHYASGWSVALPDGTVVGEAELRKPHVGIPEFETKLKGIDVPPGTTYLLIRARCNLVGWSPAVTRVDLPAAGERAP